MVYKKKRSKRTFRRGRFGKKFTKKFSVPTNVVQKVGFPNKFQTKLRYSEHGSLASAMVGIVNQEYRLNSVYDPDLTGGGNQPNFYTTFKEVYSKYRVVGCKVFLTLFTDGSGTGPYSCKASMLAYDATSGALSNLATGDAYAGMPNGYSRVLSGNAGNMQKVIYSKYFPISRIAGVRPQTVLADDLFAAGTGANPSKDLRLRISVDSFAGGAAVTAYYNVDLTYYVRFEDPIMQVQS